MNETPTRQTIDPSADDAAKTMVAPNRPPGSSRHYYRIGIIGSIASGKTCLLAALGMARNPNSLGHTATRIAVEDESNADLCKGNEWLNEAISALEDGRWPAPTFHERATVRFRFTDGQTRQKYVELVDYSGELLNPKKAHGVLAASLRELLREMDGLIVLAQHPLPGQDSSKLETVLNGLLGVFALLNVGCQKNPTTAARQIPIAMIVNKWDRSPHFDASPSGEREAGVMLDKFLASEPQPFHASVAKALLPAAGGRFKSFPVSAVGAVRRECAGDQVRELPPAKGMLGSFGVEQPFLWVIQERDNSDIAEQEKTLKRRSNWFRPPWSRWLRKPDFSTLRSHFDPATPESEKMTVILRKSWLLAIRQLLIYIMAVLALEGIVDIGGHRYAEECIKNPGSGPGWQAGAAWLVDYGRSNPLRHMLYCTAYLPKQSALDRANQVWEEKDKQAFDCLPMLSVNSPGPGDEERFADAAQEASKQATAFPNSSRNPARQEVVAKVKHLRDDLAFVKLLRGWSQGLDNLRPTDTESARAVQTKLEKLGVLVTEVRVNPTVPLAGPLHEKWKAILEDTDSVCKSLIAKLSTLDLAAGIRQAMAADEYLQAADLLVLPAFQRNPDPNLLTEFQLNLSERVAERCKTLSQQGGNWKKAVEYAEQFLAPRRRDAMNDTLIHSIPNIVSDAKNQGDKYLYNLARDNKDNDALDGYIQNSPQKSMLQEVTSYMKWLEEREVPRPLTFRIVKIQWNGAPAQGWGERTVIKLYVANDMDSRNSDYLDNPRNGTTHDRAGIRSVRVKNCSQGEPVVIATQLWNISRVFKKWEPIGHLRKEISPEDLSRQPCIVDDGGCRIEFSIDGVLEKPSLPDWHCPQ